MNRLHVPDELRPVEERYPVVLVVIGVHSPTFVHEADARALPDAVERYGAPPGAGRSRAGYVAALGGTLELIVDLGDEQLKIA